MSSQILQATQNVNQNFHQNTSTLSPPTAATSRWTNALESPFIVPSPGGAMPPIHRGQIAKRHSVGVHCVNPRPTTPPSVGSGRSRNRRDVDASMYTMLRKTEEVGVDPEICAQLRVCKYAILRNGVSRLWEYERDLDNPTYRLGDAINQYGSRSLRRVALRRNPNAHIRLPVVNR